MKKRAYLIQIVILICMSTAIAQEAPAGLTNAFKKGSAQALSAYFGNKVELVVLNHIENCDKQRARQMMDDFFVANKVNSFTVNHQGQRDESSFIIGTLATSGGNYRINCFFKKTENQYLIYQIRIDKTDE